VDNEAIEFKLIYRHEQPLGIDCGIGREFHDRLVILFITLQPMGDYKELIFPLRRILPSPFRASLRTSTAGAGNALLWQ